MLTGGSDEKLSSDWKSYWRFDRTPFVEHDPPYVSLPSHDEAARLLFECIRSGGRGAELIAEAGLGKTTVLRRVFAEVRSPRRRCILMSCPREADLLPGLLAEHLGERLGREPGRLACWRAVERALRLMSILGNHIVIGFDDCQNATPAVRRDIAVLTGLGTGFHARLTIIQAGRPRVMPYANRTRPWSLAIRLDSLTRSDAERYLAAKLAAAGCNEPLFTPRAITRLHCSTAGVPRAIDQLATCCLMVGAAHGIAAIPPDLVDAVESGTPGLTSHMCGAPHAG